MDKSKSSPHATSIAERAGTALFQCQRFEYGVKTLLYTLAVCGCGFDKDEAIGIVEGKHALTLGQAMGKVKSYLSGPDDLWEPIDKALEARNHFVHHGLFQASIESQSHSEVTANLTELCAAIEVASDRIREILSGLGASIGVDLDRIESDAKAKSVG